MDEINDFFNFAKPFKREVVAAPVRRRKEPELDEIQIDRGIEKRTERGTDYVHRYQEAEMDQLYKTFSTKSSISDNPRPGPSSRFTNDTDFSDLDSLTGTESEFSEAVGPKRTDDVYERYKFNYIPPKLPIVESKDEIIDAINNNPAIVLQGSTGCGKTTQVPQMILDHAQTTREYCNIIVTQPRRIAAQSIAQRVCNERGWPLGTLVGYQVGLCSKSNEDTRILYCTTGVLLEKLVKRKTMSNYTHVILDEVHERDQDMDFLFIIVRRLLATNSSHVKIILMSATIEAPLFAEYFRMPIKGQIQAAPIINIERKSTFSVREFYLDQLAKLKTEVDVDIDDPGIDNDMYIVALKLCIICDKLDQTEEQLRPEAGRPSILMFLPGIYEIERMYKELEKWRTYKETKHLILTLHSTVTIEEQHRVFRAAPPGHRKIILSTNIAESSITVPDVKYVIDFCLTKLLVTDSTTNFTSLRLDWASKNSLRFR